MKVEFNGDSYTVENRTGRAVCTGCVISKDKKHLKCPADSKGQCILPFTKIYIDCDDHQVFKL